MVNLIFLDTFNSYIHCTIYFFVNSARNTLRYMKVLYCMRQVGTCTSLQSTRITLKYMKVYCGRLGPVPLYIQSARDYLEVHEAVLRQVGTCASVHTVYQCTYSLPGFTLRYMKVYGGRSGPVPLYISLPVVHTFYQDYLVVHEGARRPVWTCGADRCSSRCPPGWPAASTTGSPSAPPPPSPSSPPRGDPATRSPVTQSRPCTWRFFFFSKSRRV